MEFYDSYVLGIEDKSQMIEYSIGGNRLGVVREEGETSLDITMFTHATELVLHWGLSAQHPKSWLSPQNLPGVQIPESTRFFDEKASESPFVMRSSALSSITIKFNKPLQYSYLNFVLRRDNTWFNNNSADYQVRLKLPDLPAELKSTDPEVRTMVFEVIEAETTGAWTLMHRFNLCNSWLSRLSNNLDGLAYIFIWMRYSSIRKLDWQRGYNTKPKDLASAQRALTFTLANSIYSSNTSDLVNKLTLLKGILSTIGKASENGQRIRDEILQIMHRGKLRTYNEGIDKNNYYEQWHQKLHNNTTPDDIGICEAVIAFNETKSMDKYWEVLSKHGITRERLCSFERPIKVEPFLAPQIVSDLYNYLELLKAVHGSVELSQCLTVCKKFVKDLGDKFDEVLAGVGHWDKILQMEKSLNLRKEIKVLKGLSIEEFREIIYLDIALEGYIRKMTEEIAHLDIRVEYLCKELRILLENIQINCDTPELNAAVKDYSNFTAGFNSKSVDPDEILLIKSICDRLQRLLISYIDSYTSLLGTKCELLSRSFSIDKETSSVFTEDCIRGSLFFSVSLLLKKLDKHLRLLITIKPWQIISPQSPVQGHLLSISSLTSVAYTKFVSPTILLCPSVSGEEEIPENVTGVICKTELDTLAHVSVRARNSQALLAVCYNEDEFEVLMKLVESEVMLVICNGAVEIKAAEAIGNHRVKVERKGVKKSLELGKIVIGMNEFEEGRTGAKGNNCAELYRRLITEIGVPVSMALPYGVYELILTLPQNRKVYQEIEKLNNSINPDSNCAGILSSIRAKILELEIQANQKDFIADSLKALNLNDELWDKAWEAIKLVWASKYNERVLLSSLKSKIDMSLIQMSVLCQEIIPGDYAFVLHTKNPTNNNTQEIYGEIVKGLGETLVGAYAGRSLAFTVNKTSSEIRIESFCNKSVFLLGSGVIFRSDSNCEDLPGFAGAGLFDSFLISPPTSHTASYSDDVLTTNPVFRRDLLLRLKSAALLIEEIFSGIPQDIEGVIKSAKIFIVQSRPQV